MIVAIPLLIVVIAGYAYALWTRDMMGSVLGTGVAGIAAAAVFIVLQAPDVAIAQAAVGAGLIPFIYIMAVAKTKRFEE